MNLIDRLFRRPHDAARSLALHGARQRSERVLAVCDAMNRRAGRDAMIPGWRK